MYPAVPLPRSGGLSALTYGSEVSPSLQDPFRLADIVARIRPLNTDLAVTGAILCGNGQIQQWIEGPEDAVALLWDRIRLDPRHRVRWATPPAVVTARHFPGSPMKLAMTTAGLARLDHVIEDVVLLPDNLAPGGTSIWADGQNSHAFDGAAGQAVSDALRNLDPAYRTTAPGLINARAAALAEVLTDADPRGAHGYIDCILRQIGVAETAATVQAVLDHVQASWMAGLLSAWQRQLAVTMLQSALRLRLDVAESPHAVGSALVSVLPGTPDMCGVILKVALLRRAGWSVRLLLPQSIEEIQLVAQGLRPDLVVLAGSRLSARPEELGMLGTLLPALAAQGAPPIILGGKLAETHPQVLLNRGAAAVCGALSWIATIAADLAAAPASPRAGDAYPPTSKVLLADNALASFLAANRTRAARNDGPNAGR